jgi:hypothetical protein
MDRCSKANSLFIQTSAANLFYLRVAGEGPSDWCGEQSSSRGPLRQSDQPESREVR